jgi:uncharacterized membrane protein YgdD (TMEM256/DUF423 family)
MPRALSGASRSGAMIPLSPRTMLVVAAGLMFFGVAAGAFGAHALRGRIAVDALGTYQTAVLYHLVHALGLIGVGLLALQWPDAARPLAWTAFLLVVGVVLFSGSLYALVLTGVRTFGVVTPVGGIAFLAGWVLLAWTAARH